MSAIDFGPDLSTRFFNCVSVDYMKYLRRALWSTRMATKRGHKRREPVRTIRAECLVRKPESQSLHPIREMDTFAGKSRKASITARKNGATGLSPALPPDRRVPFQVEGYGRPSRPPRGVLLRRARKGSQGDNIKEK